MTHDMDKGRMQLHRHLIQLREVYTEEMNVWERLERRAAEEGEDTSHELTCSCHWCTTLRAALFARKPDGSYICTLEDVEAVAAVWAVMTTNMRLEASRKIQ